MTWFRVDDGFGEHRKVDALGPDLTLALSVWLLCGSGSARARTDGKVTLTALARHCATMRERDRIRGADALVRVGLWEKSTDGDGWVFHEWDEHQPLRADLERAADLGRKRKEEWKERKRAERSASVAERERNAVPPAFGTRPQNVTGTHAPTRPDPTRPDPVVVEKPSHPHLAWLLALYESWRALTGAVPGTGSADKLAHAWADPWRLTPQERATLERAQAVHGVFGDDLEALRRAVTAFGADDYARKKGLPFALFASQAATYATKREHVSGVSDFSHVPDGEAF